MPKSQLKWDADDANAPDDALKVKIAAFRARQTTLKPEERYKPENRELFIPVAEMPAGTQDIIKRQIAYIEGDFRRNNTERVRTDAVQVQTRPTMVTVLPGGQALEMSQLGIEGYGTEGDVEPIVTPPRPTSLTLPAEISQRILIISPTTPDEARQAVTVARTRGFTAVWVAVCPTEIALVEAAVAAGKKAGIPVGALVHVLRSGGDTALPPDINLLGETETAAARRQAREPQATARAAGFNDDYFNTEDRAATAKNHAERNQTRAKRWGDWLRGDLIEVRARVASKVSAIAKVPGLTGIALTDLLPPGYVGADPAGIGGFGYNDAMRLDFLRKYGVDPIDLSPLQQGQFRVADYFYGEYQLPFFTDYGLTGKYSNSSSVYNGVSSDYLGAKDAAEKWLEYRTSIAREFTLSLARSLRTAAPSVPLYAYRLGNGDSPYEMRWAAELNGTEKALDSIVPPLTALRQPNQGGEVETPAPRQKSFKDTIKENAKRAILIALYRAGFPGDPRAQFVQQMQLTIGMGAKEWDGLIIDLSDVPLDTALPLLEVIRMPAAGPKPTP